MNYTYFYLKLFANPESDGKTREFISTIKLNYPIRGAKFFKIYNLFINNTILLVKCDLIDKKNIYTNVRDANNYADYVFNEQSFFIGYGDQFNGRIKIDSSKRLINEFTISVKNLNNEVFDVVEIEDASVKIKIFHE